MALRRGKTVEQIYQKKTQLEHILLRPDTYVGSTEAQQQEMWVFDEPSGEMVNRKITYVPALYKIFDEILVNAADNMVRDPRGMDLIDVTVDAAAGFVSVLNNGSGIPVQMHREHQCYVPELIFGHLLTSDNYDDDEKKVTGGRNGYGAKLTNVFSKKFIVETADKKTKKKYKQVFEANMSRKHAPEIVDHAGAEFTRVTFYPDLQKFGMARIDDDIKSLMMKRVYDIAGATERRCRVVLNGRQLPITCFQEYVDMFLQRRQDEDPVPCIYERCSPRWEVAVSVTDGAFQQVSFVNAICTVKGGTHVTHVADQLVEAILKTVRSKNKGGIDIKPAMVRNHLWVFVNCLIENPAFDSQTKETLTSKSSRFGSTCELSEKTLKAVLKSGVVEIILDWAKAKEKVDIGKQLRAGKGNATRVLGIPKLEDANWAGGKHSAECTLILTEGDSAKSLAVAGLGVIGRDKYGVFPLKGKVLNVREANYKQVTGNAEIQNLLKILGIDTRRQYDSVCDLRYGSVMIMTDQDHDGSHIKGLLINLVHYWWPSLLKLGFLKEFVTPIVKVWREGRKDGQRSAERSFFTMNEYEQWRASQRGVSGWKTKYYKGLGTSTMKEAKEYFRDIDHHEIGFLWSGDQDGEAIDLAFNKKRADDRKEWINGHREGDNVDHAQKQLAYGDFVHKELVQFAKYDVMRSIPSVVDGFKPSQRKVIFSAFKKKLKSDIKVAQFVGYISEQAAYHHGEMSLEHTIVNLAQNFVGSNNVNLLVPSGQFGTRIMGGKDHAAARYIYTRLSPVTRLIFHPDDDHILDYLDEEGQRIEPKWYCPILPMVLVNGAEGIGTGWSTQVPNHDPREVVRNIRRLLRGLPMECMRPWYRGFHGGITPNEAEPGRLEVTGVAERGADNTLEITELPVKVWTQNYKEFLEQLMPEEGRRRGESSGHTIEDFREYHTENAVRFVVKLAREKAAKLADKQSVEKAFKLKTSMATSNMFLFNHEGRIMRYTSALEILEEFCVLRREMYVKRKNYLVGKLTREKEILSNRARFILMVVKGELELRQRKKAELLAEMQRLGFKGMRELNALERSALAGDGAEEPAAGEEAAEKSDYDYLLGMALWSLTYEKVEEIRKQLEAKTAELQALLATTVEQLWDRDLDALSECLDQIDAEEAEEAASSARLGGAAGAGGRGRRGKAPRTGGRGELNFGSAATPSASSSAPPRPRPRAAEDEGLRRRPVLDCAAALGRVAALGAARRNEEGAVDLATGVSAGAPRGLRRLAAAQQAGSATAGAVGGGSVEDEVKFVSPADGGVVDIDAPPPAARQRLGPPAPPPEARHSACVSLLDEEAQEEPAAELGRRPTPLRAAPFFTPLAPAAATSVPPPAAAPLTRRLRPAPSATPGGAAPLDPEAFLLAAAEAHGLLGSAAAVAPPLAASRTCGGGDGEDDVPLVSGAAGGPAPQPPPAPRPPTGGEGARTPGLMGQLAGLMGQLAGMRGRQPSPPPPGAGGVSAAPRGVQTSPLATLVDSDDEPLTRRRQRKRRIVDDDSDGDVRMLPPPG